jgi:membrane-associated phospholipid phosphatase
MPLLILILLALTVGCVVGAVTWRYPRGAALSPAPALDVARAVGETARAHPGLRGALVPRLDPETATGLALTLALLFTVVGGVLLGLLAYLVRSSSHLIRFDNGVAKWGARHASAVSTHGLNAVTQLGSIYTVVGLCVLLAVVETLRTRSQWIVPFIIVAVGGEEALTTIVKHVVDRTRPAFNPAAATLGPSFPSGHAATAAVFYATAALLLGRRRGHTARTVLTALAAGIAVAVAASRVLLDVHWLTDVIAGLALGWAWFAVCAIAFGGRLLRFGVAAEVAGRAAERPAPDQPGRVPKVKSIL